MEIDVWCFMEKSILLLRFTQRSDEKYGEAGWQERKQTIKKKYVTRDALIIKQNTTLKQY